MVPGEIPESGLHRRTRTRPGHHALEHLFLFCPDRSEQFSPPSDGSGSALPALVQRLLKAAVLPGHDTDLLDDLYDQALRQGLWDVAAGCLGTACLKIWDSGQDFSRFSHWIEEGEQLLPRLEDLSHLARAYFLLNQIMALITGPVDLKKALTLVDECRNAIDRTGAANLHLLQGAILANLYYWRGDLDTLEIILEDSAPYLDHPRASPFAVLHHRATHGLLMTLRGAPNQGRAILTPLLDHADLEHLPPMAWMLVHNHLLYTEAALARHDRVRRLARKIRERTIPEQNHYYHSYLQFTLAMAELSLGHPHKALRHGRECQRRGTLCQSPNARRMSALVIGQALADLGRTREAMVHFQEWIERWSQADYRFIAATGCAELAEIYLHLGRVDQARSMVSRIRTLLPAATELPCLHRPADTLEQLRHRLFPAKDKPLVCLPACPPIRIHTFGGLDIRVGDDRTLYDRNWRGNMSKKLLAAILVHGPQKVGTSFLADLLWPDADGDRAMNSFKVTLSRLRKTVAGDDPSLKNWIVVKQKQVSLVSSLCWIDCQEFLALAPDECADTAADLLKRGVALYRGDFLAHNGDDGWLYGHREYLRQRYISAVLSLHAHYRQSGNYLETITLLENAIHHDPKNEYLYSLLVTAHLDKDNLSKAREVYRRACSRLGRRPAPENDPAHLFSSTFPLP